MKNKWMFWGGLMLTIGSFILIPLILFGTAFYTKKSPEQIINNPESGMLIPILAIAAGIFIPLTGIGLLLGSILIPLFSKTKEDNRIIKQGTAAEAKVLEIKEIGMEVNHNPMANLTLEVYPPGQPSFITGVSKTILRMHLPAYQPGMILEIRFIPGTQETVVIGPKPV